MVGSFTERERTMMGGGGSPGEFLPGAFGFGFAAVKPMTSSLRIRPPLPVPVTLVRSI